MPTCNLHSIRSPCGDGHIRRSAPRAAGWISCSRRFATANHSTRIGSFWSTTRSRTSSHSPRPPRRRQGCARAPRRGRCTPRCVRADGRRRLPIGDLTSRKPILPIWSARWLVLACMDAMRPHEADVWDDAIRRHDRRVYLSVLALGLAPDRAREITQMTWTRLIEQHAKGALAELDFPGLAVRQARYLALNTHQRDRTELRVLAAVPDTGPPPTDQPRHSRHDRRWHHDRGQGRAVAGRLPGRARVARALVSLRSKRASAAHRAAQAARCRGRGARAPALNKFARIQTRR